MAGRELTRELFDARRRKEHLAFLVVKFLRASVSFMTINADFHDPKTNACLAGCGLFERVHELAESLVFDLKEKAHILFRADARAATDARAAAKAAAARGTAGAGKARPRDPRQLLAGMKNGIETRAVDSYIGTGYHLLLILQEALYQIDRYTPELEREKSEIGGVLELARSTGAPLRPDDQAELERLHALDEISVRLAAESRELATRMMERCEALFAGTAVVIRHLMVSANENEILILNLLENQELLEKVYGVGAAESIFSELCRGKGFSGKTGVERALNYARAKCGNVTALAGFPPSRPPHAGA
ncbi:MAG: hypothetical protein ABSG63_09835 [Spirochaetia bacterium]|jgi:hypothetical protein